MNQQALQAAVDVGAPELEPLQGPRRIFRALGGHALVAMALVERGGLLIEANTALARVLGRTRGELAGEPVEGLLHPTDVSRWQTFLRQLGSGREQWCIELRWALRRGEWLTARVTVGTLAGPDALVLMVEPAAGQLWTGASELGAQAAGLGERLEEVLRRARARGQSVLFMCVGLENVAGGDGLQAPALSDCLQRLQAALPTASVVAPLPERRLLAAIEGNAALINAGSMARAALRALAAREAGPVGVSIGLALFDLDGEDHPGLLAAADRAMRQARAAGGNTYCFYSPRLVAPGEPASAQAAETAARGLLLGC